MNIITSYFDIITLHDLLTNKYDDYARVIRIWGKMQFGRGVKGMSRSIKQACNLY